MPNEDRIDGFHYSVIIQILLWVIYVKYLDTCTRLLHVYVLDYEIDFLGSEWLLAPTRKTARYLVPIIDLPFVHYKMFKLLLCYIVEVLCK